MSAYWEDNENDGLPDDDDLLDAAVAAAKQSPDEMLDALLGLIGLVQIIVSRDDVPTDVKTAILSNHRYLDARSVAKLYL